LELENEDPYLIEENIVHPPTSSTENFGFFHSMMMFKDYKIPIHQIAEVIMTQLNNEEKLTPTFLNLLVTQINFDMRNISTTIPTA
jgi:hypothetical protein